MKKLILNSITYNFNNYTVILDNKGNAMVNNTNIGKYQFVKMSQDRAKKAIEIYKTKYEK